MSEVARHGLTGEQFYRWVSGLDARYEFVDGDPVLTAGANRRHDRVVINAIYALTGQLRGKPCQPFSSDTYVSIPNGNRRMPDLGVDCGAMEDDSLEAIEPRLVVEVTSPSTGALTEPISSKNTRRSQVSNTYCSSIPIFHRCGFTGGTRWGCGLLKK